MKCPNCGNENPEDFRFCGTCGSLIEKLPAPTSPAFVESQRKHISVLFADVSGYTEMTEQLDPEEVSDIMTSIFKLITTIVEKYDGFIERFIGDEVMTMFGVPKVHEDHAIRAIRAAQEIRSAVAPIGRSLEKRVGFRLAMHSGINTGLVVTGGVNLIEGTHGVTGDAVNTAARLKSLAEPGEILVGQETHRLAESHFLFREMEPRKVKGKRDPVNYFQLIGRRPTGVRPEIHAGAELSPLVGRQADLSRLMIGFHEAAAGKGTAAAIISGAGVGKSRLLHEFKKATPAAVYTYLEGKCQSFATEEAYQPIIGLLEPVFAFQESDTSPVRGERIVQTLGELNLSGEEHTAPLLDLFGVEEGAVDNIQTSPVSRDERIAQAVVHLLAAMASNRPLVIAVEDLHWIDPRSKGVLQTLLDVILQHPILLVLTSRTDLPADWFDDTSHIHIQLDRLSATETNDLVARLLGTARVATDIQEVFREKAAGVPLYIEELVKSMTGLDIISEKDGIYRIRKGASAVAVPSTIHDIIMARVDALDETARSILQTGAVIERQFSYPLLKHVSGVSDAELRDQLDALVASGFLIKLLSPADTTYVFNHALTRDAVYQSILRKKRKSLHGQIGEAMEAIYADNLEGHYNAIISHFRLAEDFDKTATHARHAFLAAEQSKRVHEAVAYSRILVDALEKQGSSESIDAAVVDARTGLGHYLFQMSDMAGAREAISPIENILLEQGPDIAKGKASIILGSYLYMVEEDFAPAVEYLKQAIEITEKAGDLETWGYAQYMLGMVLSFNCDFEDAADYFQTLLDLSASLESPWRVSAMKSNLSVYCYDYQGLVAKGFQTSEEAVRIADTAGDLYSSAMAYASHGTSCYYRGQLDAARIHLTIGAKLTAKLDMFAHQALSHQYLGHVFFEMGDFESAMHHYTEAIHVRELSRVSSSSADLNRIAHMRARVYAGETDVNPESLYGYARETRVNIYQGSMSRLIGDILMHLGGDWFERAEQWIKDAIVADTRNGMRCDVGWDHLLYGEWSKRQGDTEAAVTHFDRASTVFEECGAEGWLPVVKKAVSDSRM